MKEKVSQETTPQETTSIAISEARINEQTVTILGEENDGQIVLVEFVDGKKYKLQHPGNRVYKTWSDNALKLNKGSVNTIYMLEQSFKHCVFPEGHDFKPTLDNVKPKHLGVWEVLLHRFLGGDLL